MAQTVIIPARNEEATLGAIVRTFATYPSQDFKVYVGLDADTTDYTATEVWERGGCVFHTDQRGKGQVVSATLEVVKRYGILSPRVILCDGDYTGLTWDHIGQLTMRYTRGVVIGVPDWPEQDVPDHVTKAWPRVSGLRCLPWYLIPGDAHGYLLETQINQRAEADRASIIYVAMNGLKSPFTWPLSDEREKARIQDKKWGEENGILRPTVVRRSRAADASGNHAVHPADSVLDSPAGGSPDGISNGTRDTAP